MRSLLSDGYLDILTVVYGVSYRYVAHYTQLFLWNPDKGRVRTGTQYALHHCQKINGKCSFTFRFSGS